MQAPHVVVDARVLESPLTGIGKSVIRLYSALLDRAPEVQLTLVHARPLAAGVPRSDTVTHWTTRLSGRLSRAAGFPLAVKRLNPSVVHYPWNGGIPWMPRSPRRAVITTIHDTLPLVIPGYFANARDRASYMRSLQRDIDRSDIVLTISEYSRHSLLQEFRVHQDPTVIQYAPTIGPPRSDVPRQFPFQYYLYVGGYDPRKGIEHLVRLFVKKRYVEPKLVLVGAVQYFSEEFRTMVEEGIRSGVVVQTGYVTDEKLSVLLRDAIALLYPSKYEGFGLPPLEAMSVGCPVITTRGTALPEVCGEAVLYVDPSDEEALAHAVDQLVSNSELRRRLIAEGLARAANFTWATAASRFAAVLSRALA